MIELVIFTLFMFVDDRFVRAFNETCDVKNPTCPKPLYCIDGRCLCSKLGLNSNAKTPPLSFWNGYECATCPLDYTTTGTKCYQLIAVKDQQVNWDRARQRCQERQSDLLVFRSAEEYRSIFASLRARVASNLMFQRTPRDGLTFASFWIGARLAKLEGDGQFNLVAHGPALTKTNSHWCAKTSPLEEQPSYLGLKPTEERQACISVAVFKDGMVCLHNWFCSMATHTLCEIQPPPPPPPPSEDDDQPQALKSARSNTWTYVGIGAAALVLVCGGIAAYFCACSKKRKVRHGRSFDSTETGMSQNSLY